MTMSTSKDSKKSTEEISDWDCMSYCIQKGIIIYPVVGEKVSFPKLPKCYIKVNYNGKPKKGQYLYKQDESLYEKILELYRHYYDRISGRG